jgi:hypothetical protein
VGHVLDVVFGRTPGDDQPGGDLPVGAAGGHQAEDLDLPVTEPGRPAAAQPRRALPGRGQYRPGRLRVAHTVADQLAQLPGGLLGGAGRPVRPGLGHGLVGVGGGQHPHRHRQVDRAAAPVVAGRVEPFVVSARPPGHRWQRPRAGQDPLGVVRVQPDLFPLGAAQRPRLFPDRRGDRHPAKVVQQRRQLQPPQIPDRQPQPATSGLGQIRHPGAVPVGERRLQIGQITERGRGGDQLPIADHQMRDGFGVEDELTGIPGVQFAQQHGGRPAKPVGQLGVERATRAAGHRGHRQLGATDAVEQGGDAGQAGHPGRQRNVATGQPPGCPAPVPPLVDVVERILHRLAEPQPSGGDPPDLAGGGDEPRTEPGTPAQRGDGEPDPGHRAAPTGQLRQECREQVAGRGEVGPRGRQVHRQLVAKDRSGLVGTTNASHVLQQRGVIDRADLLLGQMQQPRQPGGQRAGPDRLSGR